jgi:hypothetical protein
VVRRRVALRASCELGRTAGDNYGAAQRGILQGIRRRANVALPSDLLPPPWPEVPDDNLLGEALAAWARACPRPLVLFFDEIDYMSEPNQPARRYQIDLALLGGRMG